MTNLNRARYWLLEAMSHARFCCTRTRQLLVLALAKLAALTAIERAAAI